MMITAVRKFSVKRLNDNKRYIVLCIQERSIPLPEGMVGNQVWYFCATEDAGSPMTKNPEWIPDSEVAKVIVDDED